MLDKIKKTIAKHTMLERNDKVLVALSGGADSVCLCLVLKELGFNIMYLCPIFEEDDSEDISHWSERQKKSGTGNPKNPYRMNNYFTIDTLSTGCPTLSDFKLVLFQFFHILANSLMPHLGHSNHFCCPPRA